jgi:peptide subunit release factor 1 (eRF1)
MKTQIKAQIKKLVKSNGSHIGVIRHLITANNPEVNFEDYKEFATSLLSKKLSNVKSSIRASVRYQ